MKKKELATLIVVASGRIALWKFISYGSEKTGGKGKYSRGFPCRKQVYRRKAGEISAPFIPDV